MNWFKSLRKALNATQPGGSHGSDESLSNFTPQAHQVLALARKEADRFRHNFVGTEHLLLGIVNLGQGTAFTVLRNMGLDSETLRLEVEKHVGTGPDDRMIGNIPYTPRAKKVLALAARESRELNHTYVGTEHILLGLLREGAGVAARVLKNLHVDIEQTRQEILRELDPNPPSATNAAKTSPSKATSTSSAPVLRSTLHIEPPVPKRDSVDTSKRYDVYCAERNEIVVYRNALFKGTKSLFQKSHYDTVSEFVEIEQPDGRTIFVARLSVIKFCEHGATPNPETASGKKP